MDIVVSGMRPTGKLHIGHFFGALKNWESLQKKYSCYYFIADLHALTTNFEHPENIKEMRREMVIDWLSVGIDIDKSVVFVQSQNIYHSELFMFLSMVTPVSWLERCPSYKELKSEFEKQGQDISNLGFLGYPVLMTGDIIMYDAKYVPVGIDQLPHIEISREIVRRFNSIYNRALFVEPEALITDVPKLPGLDGRKMSKSYNNTILLSEELKSVETKILRMKTDTTRKRRTDKGNPDICPVFDYHKVFSTDDEKKEVVYGCRSAKIGCVDCKKILIKHMLEFLAPIQEKRAEYEKKIDDIDDLLKDSQNKANKMAEHKMELVKGTLKL